MKSFFCVVLIVAVSFASFAGGKTEAHVASDGPTVITGWIPYATPPVSDIAGIDDMILWRELPTRINIKVDWQTVSPAEYQVHLALLIASGNLPDFIGRITSTLAFQYGAQGALRPLNEHIESEAPNLLTILGNTPAIRAQITSPEGQIFGFPRVLEDPRARAFTGFHINGEWLNRLGLTTPDTTDELRTVLRAFKNQDPNENGQTDEIPYSLDPIPLLWLFGVENGFFVEDQQVKYGPVDPRYEAAVRYISELFAEGLIDAEYLNQTNDIINAKVSAERIGFVFGSNQGQLSNYNLLLASAGKTPGFVSIPPPQGPSGERNNFRVHSETDNTSSAAISITSQKASDVTRMMDYLYGEEGRILMNFGLEGETFTFVNGVPTYTDKVMSHPTLTAVAYRTAYISPLSSFAAYLMGEAYLGGLRDDAQAANPISVQHMGDKKIPPIPFTQDELNLIQSLQRDIDTFVLENLHAFIRGVKPLTEFGAFRSTLNRMNVNQLTATYNTAYQRYMRAVRN